MSVKDGEDYLEESIKSILNQSYKNFEFLICDDGSTDKSLAICNKFAEEDSRVRIFTNSHTIGLTKSLGKELALKNIAVNCVTPAAAKTRIFDQMTEEHINYMLSKIPRNKFAKVNELASLVTYLASEENSFATAAVFDLSGGRATY